MKKRIFSLLLVCSLALTLLPTAFAAGPAYTDYDGDPIPSGYTTSDGTAISVRRLDRSLIWRQLYEGGYLSFIRRDKATGQDISYGLYDLKNDTIYFESPNQDFKGDTVLWESRDWCDGREQFEGIDPYTGQTGYGFLDMKGNVIVPPKYIQVEDYQDGMAEVCVYDSTHSVRIGYVDLNGNEVIPAVYASPTSTSAEGFNDGYVWVKGSPTNAFHYMLLDKAGDTVLELPGYEVEWTSSYGISKVTQDTKCFQPVTRFSNGYAVLEFVGFQYTEPDNIGYMPVTAKEDLGLTDYMLIDLQGDLTPFDKDFFYSGDGTYWNQWDNYMKRGFVLSYRSGRYGVLDQNGAVSIPYLYGEMQRDPFLNGVAMVQRDSGEPGSIIDLKGNTIIPEGEWQSLSAFVDGYALATQTGKSDEGYYTIDTYLLTIEGAGSSAPADPAPAQPAADQPSSWAAGQVDEAVSAGIVPENLRSAYTQSITRAEFCALATRLYETVKGTAIAERVTFTDTADENVEKMAALGVVTGTGDGAFDPGGLLTREQAATMLARLSDAVGAPLPAGSPTFPDAASISSWASEAVGRVQAGGVMSGTDTGTFDPAGPYTREQSILTMLRLYHTI